MGRGGDGGGPSGRSSGGSSGRSFGGRSSGSHRGGGSFNRSTNSGGSSFSGMPRISTHHIYGGGYGYGGDYGYPVRRTGGMLGWAVSRILTVIVMLAIIFIAAAAMGSARITPSTIEREPIKPYAAFSDNCIDDGAGWVTDKKTLLRGMESFYKATGVQPALAIYEAVDGEKYASNDKIEAFITKEYDKLIGHEKGVLLLFCEYQPSDYYTYYMAGKEAQSVMDSEACDILLDYADSLYTDDSYSDEGFFGAVFEKTGKHIMAVTPTIASKIPVMVFGVVIIAGFVIILKIIRQKHKRDIERAAETERILNSPIDRI